MLNLSQFLALKWFFSSNKLNVVKLLSALTIWAIAIGTAALVVILSTFNGFEEIAIHLYQSVETDLILKNKDDSKFTNIDEIKNILTQDKRIKAFSFGHMQNVYFKYKDKDYVGNLKCVDSNYFKTNDILKFTLLKDSLLNDEFYHYAMIGAGIAQKLLINVESGIDPIEVYFPNKTFKIGSKDAFFSKFFLMPTNSFSIYDEYDNAWVIAPMEFLEDNFPDDTIHASMVEISLTQSDKWAEVQNDLAKKLGESKLVLNRHERNQGIYQMTQIEKLLVFIILLFIMILLSLNFMGSLTMHYLEKSKNFLALLSMGATNRDLQKTYLLLGIFQGISGTLIGLTLGLLICYLQLWFGLVKMPTNSTFILQNYPIKILFKDIALICISVLLVTSFVSFLTSRLNFRNSIA